MKMPKINAQHVKLIICAYLKAFFLFVDAETSPYWKRLEDIQRATTS